MSGTPPDWPSEAWKALPGVIGSFAAMRWLTGSFWQKSVMFVTGASFARYAREPLSGWTGIDGGLSGFLLGLFGMMIAAKVFEGIEAVNAAEIGVAFKDRIRKWMGV